MKFKTISVMAIFCLILSAFLFGMYFGRNIGNNTVEISQITHTTGATDATNPVPTDTQATSVTTPTFTEAPTQPSTAGKVNINTADLATLMTLEGIGQTYAQRIIDYRNEHGPFDTIADITNVPGIGAKRFEAIMDDITVGE